MEKILRTKCIASLGPASYPAEVVEAMIANGVYMFRNNFSHMPYEEYVKMQTMVRQINERRGTNVLMQVDLQGPHIRIGKVADEGLFLEENQVYTFTTEAGEPQEYDIPIRDNYIHQFVRVGQPILFVNGVVEGEIVAVEGHRISVRIITSGTIKTAKAINLPETELDSCLTEKDKADIAFLVEQGADWIALSFVSRAEEIAQLRKLLGGAPIKIMSKVERRSALANIEEIAQASDAVMVARGDLGVELPMEDVPFIQKDIIAVCHRLNTPVIVATQLLYSLVHSARPTRAEVADVTQAVLEKADALLLSDETTEGLDPAGAIKILNTIIGRAEKYLYDDPHYLDI